MQYSDISYLGLQELNLTEITSLDAGTIIWPTKVAGRLAIKIYDWLFAEEEVVYYGGELSPAICRG